MSETQQTYTKTNEISTVLEERASNYGSFEDHASLSQELKNCVQSHPNWTENTTPAQRESIEMILHKVARIVNGDPNYKDSWTDIIGYTKLIEQKL